MINEKTAILETSTTPQTIRIALAGNPNTGKTTLFNALTGLNHKVGNYPGVTVERKVGFFMLGKCMATLVDLPGTYSLAARSPDEMLVVDILLGQQKGEDPVDLILAIVDASNINRNFYLVSQLLELGLPMVIALNMVDVATTKGIQIDTEGLSRRLGVPVVPICASRREGLQELGQVLGDISSLKRKAATETPAFPESMHVSLDHLKSWIQQNASSTPREIQEPELFRALIDRKGYAERRLGELLGDSFLQTLQQERTSGSSNSPLASLEVKIRYEWISSLLGQFVRRPEQYVNSTSDRIDQILTHRVWGTLIFFGLMAFMFQAIYTWSAPFMDVIDGLFSRLGDWIGGSMAEGALRSMMVDGVISGVGGVLIFLPQIVCLFLFIAILEDCGYMPRAAFLMDRIFSRFGLSGKSFIPMLSSFACAIPGVMATRTIENREDRLTTMMVAPLMSCSARLPVYIIFIAAFIPNENLAGNWINLQGLTLFAMYLVGILVAIPVAWALKLWLSKGEPAPFILEMPMYKRPLVRNVFLYVYDRAKEFVIRAGTIIFCVTIMVWALAYFPRSSEIQEKYAVQRTALEESYKSEITPLLQSFDSERYLSSMTGEECIQAMEEDSRLQAEKNEDTKTSAGEENNTSANEENTALSTLLEKKEIFESARVQLNNGENGDALRNSYLGRMGHFIEPMVSPLGWDWRIGMATLASFPAREIIVATLGTIFNLGQDEDESSTAMRDALKTAVRADGTPLITTAVALSIMVFFALCCQCAATLATIKRETNSYRWPAFTFVYMTILAYAGAWITFHAAQWAGW